MADSQCPATTRVAEAYGIQCKFTKGHDGDHCGNAGIGARDVFWPQETAVNADGGPSDEDRIRDAMAEAMDHPGRTITR